MRLSQWTPSSPSVLAAWRMVAQSDWLPMMMAIGAVMRVNSYRESRSIGRIIGSGPTTARRGKGTLMDYPVLVNPGKPSKAGLNKDGDEKKTPGTRGRDWQAPQGFRTSAQDPFVALKHNSGHSRSCKGHSPRAARRTRKSAEAHWGLAGIR